jgi:hypothetical protein
VDEDRFVPFAVLLRAGASGSSSAHEPDARPAASPRVPEPAAPDDGDFAGDLALLRAAAMEAFERASARLLRGLAEHVLARELALAPCDTDALVRRFLAEVAAYEPLALVLSPADAGRVRAPLPVRVDAALSAGDAIVEVRDGAFEWRLSFRLQSLLAAAWRATG